MQVPTQAITGLAMKVRLVPWLALALFRTFGVRDGARRARHELRTRRGRYKRIPVLAMPAEFEPLGFLAPEGAVLSAAEREAAISRADRVAGGEYQAFEGNWRTLPRTPREWHENPVTNRLHGDPNDPWWRIETLSDAGDIKDLWEPARFGWTYDLLRGFAVTGEQRYRQTFFEVLTTWVEANPPFLGPHWGCGQETSIRAVALLAAETGFGPLTDNEQTLLQRVLFWSGERVDDAIGYAISQRNNHGISEAMGLITLGTRFSPGSGDARRWLARGTKLLDRLVLKQFSDDGWYSQHSFNYLRLALHQCVLAELTLQARGEGIAARSRERLRRAAGLLKAVMTSADGLVPHYGADDGANVLPLSLAPHSDFRPILSLACSVFGVTYPADQQLDAQSLRWLGVPDPEVAGLAADGVVTGQSGWVVGRLGRYQFFLRAGRYKSRPGQVDPLQLELWIDGHPIIVDPGTYSYRATGTESLATYAAHNGPKVAGYEPAVAGPRFLTLKFPASHLVDASFSGDAIRVIAEIPGVVRRTVDLSSEGLRISDSALVRGQAMSVNWLLHPDAYPTVSFDGCRTPAGSVESPPIDWLAPTYGQRIAARSYFCDQLGPSTEIVSRFAANG